MSGSLLHSPADVARWALVQAGAGTDPTLSTLQEWPIFTDRENDAVDDCITIYNTAGKVQGRTHNDGEMQLQHGVQVRIRSTDPKSGHTRSRFVAEIMDKTIYDAIVDIDTSQYRLHAFTRTTDVIPLGKEVGSTKRNLFTINATISLRQLS